MDRMLDRLEKLSQNGTLDKLLKLAELGQSPQAQQALVHLDSIMKSLPKGKQGDALLTRLISLLEELIPRLDRLERVAGALFKED